MQQATELATQKFTGLLPEGADFVTLEELLNRGFPEFLVMQIKNEILRNFEQELNLSENKWLQYHTKTKTAWNDFAAGISDHLRLPLSYATSIIRKAAGDVLQLLTEPRACMAEFLFLTDQELDYAEVVRRSEALAVYRHFGRALPRFMEKKELSEILKEQCAYFITALDEKLIARYTSSDWEKLFQPWFALMGPAIEPALIQHFFTDKEEKEIAARFGEQQSALSQDKIIHIINGTEGIEYGNDTEPALQEPVVKPIRLNEEISEETIAGAMNDTRDYEETSILERARKAESDDNEPETPESVQGDDANEKFNALFSRFQKPEDEGGETEDIPMWKRYVSEDDEENQDTDESVSTEPHAAPEPEQDEHSLHAMYEEEAEEETPVKQTDNRKEDLDILQYVDDYKDYFVDNLFGGQEDVYQDVLEGIQNCSDWNEAIRYLNENVYKPNFIDIYSEPAVDFTDAMQNYFKDKMADQ